MLKQLEGARLGIFIFLGTVLFVIAIFLIGNKESLFATTINIKSRFPDVQGLKSGAPVRLSGMDIGSVGAIALVDDSSGIVEVNLKIENSVKHLIRLDSEATIETEGLVGKKIIVVSPGSMEYEMISENGLIKAKPPVSISEIIGESQATISNIKLITKDFSEIVNKINRGTGTIGKLVNDDRLYFAAVNVSESADTSLNLMTERFDVISSYVLEAGASVEQIIAGLDSLINDVQLVVDSVRGGRGVLGKLITESSLLDSVKIVMDNLVRTSSAAFNGAEGFSENMEALKHNWLFKDYFEARGYWDKSEYEKELDKKLKEIKLQNEILDQKIEELKELEKKNTK